MIAKLLEFLQEDVGRGDITTEATIPEGKVIKATITSKKDGILAGLEECCELLRHFGLEYNPSFKDGDKIKEGDEVLEIRGNARKILTLERLLLNLLMRMSGIATLTNSLVEKCGRYGVTIAGTRKTTPGFRYFEKKAIKIGGGHPHRYSLDECFLIKDNHIAIAGLEEAIKKAKEDFTRKVEVEVSSLEDALKACRAGVDIVMLDNMDPSAVKMTISKLEEEGLRGKVEIELSGGITAENIEAFAEARPDIISIGSLTTDSKWLDMSMRVG
jgi:nicotinate-nucleotide pyrophosphorylase (carboxylating)